MEKINSPLDQKVSKPGLRISKNTKFTKVLGGLGVAIISTSKVMSDRDAKNKALAAKFFVSFIKEY